jgi:hypothetical protein
MNSCDDCYNDNRSHDAGWAAHVEAFSRFRLSRADTATEAPCRATSASDLIAWYHPPIVTVFCGGYGLTKTTTHFLARRRRAATQCG